MTDLPIAEALPRLLKGLAEGNNAVLQAPPGAGKTTGVPLALLDQPWLGGAKIIMLEPRRLAARAAARRMAFLLGEPVGATVGYRIRLETKVGPKTRIEVVTDGIFTRLIQANPSLAGIGAVLFDEFHERRLESDLGLALALDAQTGLRPELRLVAMSATLDAEPVAKLLSAPIVTSEGRAFPVERRWRPQPQPDRMIDAVVETILDAVEEPGGILVFLPGGGEIRRVERRLGDQRLPPGTDVLPLFGDLDQTAQDRALAPPPPGRRKIVLATSIAETSLTIDGIRQVVDCGLARQSRFDPRTGLTRLETVRVTQAAAEQRAGRAGRTEPGIAWRLWPEVAHAALAPRPQPEIATADLAPLALELAAWGVADPAALPLLDPPSAPGLAAARRLLTEFAALGADGRITPHGARMATLGLAPRLAHMVLRAAEDGDGPLACLIAAILSERDGASRDTDLRTRIERAVAAAQGRRVREIARRTARQAGIAWGEVAPNRAGTVLAAAYPDRIAQRRAQAGRFLMSGGQGAYLPEGDPLAAEPMLVVADLDGQMPESRIWLAAPLAPAELALLFADRLTEAEELWYEPATRSVQARRRRRFAALVLGEAPIDRPDPARVAAALLDGIAREGLSVLPWTPAATALRQRASFLARLDGPDAGWPDCSEAGLLAARSEWLEPALLGKRGLNELGGLDLSALLLARLDHRQRRDLEQRAPTHLTVPSGSRIAIDYGGETPVLAVKLQELFGLASHPTIADGKVRLVLHLLSPAQRPIQVTSDLPGFWTGSYKAVRADLRGRYPRHPWPEDPLVATPTAWAKPRGT